MKLINASDLIQLLCINMDSGEQFDKATHCVDVMPTVDAVPVIRCRDCKWWQDKSAYGDFPICVDYERSMNAEDFCSRAERKEHETD